MDYLDLYCLFLCGIFGLIFGSFLNCMSMRIVRGEDFIRGHSHCMSCGHALSGRDLIPVAGYLLSRGRCRYCRARISIRYPVTEIAFAIMIAGIYLHSGRSILSVRDMILTGCLFSLSLVDIESYTIPDGILLTALGDWIVFAFFVYRNIGDAAIHVAGGLGAFLVMLGVSLLADKVLGRESLGGGDIKLFGILGLFLGPLGVYFLIILSCLIGLIVAAVLRIFDRLGEGGAFPFGPSISLAGYIMLVFGNHISEWYIGFF